MTDLSELIQESASRSEPSFVESPPVRNGGVDPLGLRETNFDLMNLVFPSINNVAVHLRPFVLVTWAWGQAGKIAKDTLGDEVAPETLREFVDRTEIIFSWSQFLRDPKVELPGGDVLKPILHSDSWVFGGEEWKKRRDTRRNSTSLMAAINYGPALKNLGWLMPLAENPSIFVPSPLVMPAINAFELELGDMIEHPAFSSFDPVEVFKREVEDWADRWSIEETTVDEKAVMRKLLFGDEAPENRQLAGNLMRAAISHSRSTDTVDVRRTMAGHPTKFQPVGDEGTALTLWRTLQVRQLFRFALEGLFYWISIELDMGSRTTQSLVEEILAQTGMKGAQLSAMLNQKAPDRAEGPVDLMENIEAALNDSDQKTLIQEILKSLAFVFREVSPEQEVVGRPDRLPVVQACREFAGFNERPISAFLKHVLESWIFAQHIYWSVGRGLGDARGRGKRLLRLKIILEEGGWMLAPSVSSASMPRPTADRLRTAISLGRECNFIPRV